MDSNELDKTHKSNESDEVASSSSHNTSENDGNSELKDEINDSYQKPTFKNALQAKKRLQAFAQPKLWISPSSKPKSNEKSTNEHDESQVVSGIGARMKKENPMDKAKATVEEIELLKMLEFSESKSTEVTSIESDEKLMNRSRSKSSEPEFIFRKRERKIRNYRRSDNSRRSPSPTITTAKDKSSDKSKHKYPRNWEEFVRDKWTFEKLMCKDSHIKSKSRNAPNDIYRQLLFDTPPASIKPFHYKSEKGDELTVPYKFLRYTSAKPKVAYNINMFKQKEPFLNRSQVLERTSRDFKVILEKFYSKNRKRCKSSEPIGQRNWYQKNWKDADSKVLETSIGLSFLQTYSDDEEEEEQPLIDPNELTKPDVNFANEIKLNAKKEREKTEDVKESNVTDIITNDVSIKVEEGISWTPERKQEDNKEDNEDQWAETPERKSVDSDKDRKKRKRSKKDYSSDSASSDEKRTKKKKKRKLDRKKKQREKEKKSRKKEKLKAEKLKKEKRKLKEKEKKKEILKKLKQELEQNFEEEQRRSGKQVKVEKSEVSEDTKKCSKKTLFDQENTEIGDGKKSEKLELMEELVNVKVKKEMVLDENDEGKEEKQARDLEKNEDEDKEKDDAKTEENPQKEETIPGEETPDTEEYQSNWESDEGISPIVKPSSKKSSRGWESDEEVFDRAFAKKQPGDVPFGAPTLLEMPLDIKFPRRRFGKQEKRRSRTRSPEYLDMEKEIKILAAERMNLNKERLQLEMEKIRIHELERKKSMEEMEQREVSSPVWQEGLSNREKWRSKEGSVESRSKERKDKEERVLRNEPEAEKPAESSIDAVKTDSSVLVLSSPEITSTKSPTHTVLESAYQEFMKAVSGGDIVISSEDCAAPSEDQTKRTKVMYSRSRRDRNRRRSVDVDRKTVISTTDPKILKEILLPGEAPPPPPVPAPVPEPIPAVATPEPARKPTEAPPTETTTSPSKPFSFSTLVIPSKKHLLVDRPDWKLDDDSDEEKPTAEKKTREEATTPPEEAEKSVKSEEKVEERREKETTKRKPSRSRSPLDSSREKRRRQDEGRRREEDRRRDTGGKRGDEGRRRGSEGETRARDRSKRTSSPSRRREPSPRRRRFSSPVHRRPSPGRHRSPPRRAQPRRTERGDRRSPPPRTSPNKRRRSHSPASRRRSPSPREASSGRAKSPRLSPMEGLKRSVADSTISDDLLPQLYPAERSASPLSSSTPAQPGRRARLALSPKRPSLDERINQVLGIESQPQATTWRPAEAQAQSDPRQNSAAYSGYQQRGDVAGFPAMPPQTSKVLQVGNILQVVPSEDLCAPPPPQPVQAPPSQKILQVGNMLQIVPSEMEPILSCLPPPEQPKESPPPEKERQSAEDVLVERMAERTKKRQEKEERRKEKEKKKREKDKKRKMRLKVSTEEMIKRALELDGYIGTEAEDLSSMVPEVVSDTPGLDPSRSILSTSTSRLLESTLKSERERKSVQFADGVRPGEGTSPSGGEELSSPPPQTEVLLKPKKFKRLGSAKKKKKKKPKVKKLKKQRPPPVPSPTASDEEYENLPPPSPPPGSPPSHVFPPRAKVHTINNIPQHYLPSYGITTAPQSPVVPPQPRMNLAYQAPPTAMYRTPPPNLANQHYPRMGHAPPMGMNVPPPTHQNQQPYGTF